MKSSSKYNDFIEYLNDGKLCLFETDTVVGLACKILNDGKINNNIQRIYDTKNRSHDKALPWLISSKEMLNEWAININDYAEDLIKEKWPGATTLIFEVKDRLPEGLCVNTPEGLNTVAFRIPNCEELINAIDFVSCPIACTSANLSGDRSPKTLDRVPKKLKEQVDFTYEKKQKPSGEPSEIISCIGSSPITLR